MIGLYSVLWGKYKEFKEKEAEEILEPIKDYCTQNETAIIQDIEANHVGIQTNQNKIHVPAAVAISSVEANKI